MVVLGFGLEEQRVWEFCSLSPGSHLVRSIILSGAMFLEGCSSGCGFSLRCASPDFGQQVPNKSVSPVCAVLRAKSKMKMMFEHVGSCLPLVKMVVSQMQCFCPISPGH